MNQESSVACAYDICTHLEWCKSHGRCRAAVDTWAPKTASPPPATTRPMQGLAAFLRDESYRMDKSCSEIHELRRWASEVEASQAQPASAPTVQPSETQRLTELLAQLRERCAETAEADARCNPEDSERIATAIRAIELDVAVRLYATPQPAAGEQPVAWRYMRPGGEFFYTDYHDPDPDCERGQPLYTSPQPPAPAQVRMPLSEEQIAQLDLRRRLHEAESDYRLRFARAIEAAHGIQDESSGAARTAGVAPISNDQQEQPK